MLCLGLKKSLSSLRLKLTAQGMVQCTNVQSQVWSLSSLYMFKDMLETDDYTIKPWHLIDPPSTSDFLGKVC